MIFEIQGILEDHVIPKDQVVSFDQVVLDSTLKNNHQTTDFQSLNLSL